MKRHYIFWILLTVLLAACNMPSSEGPDEFATALAAFETPLPGSDAATSQPNDPQTGAVAGVDDHATADPYEPAGKIVFTCQTTVDYRKNQVCVMNADGSDWRKLTFDDESDHFFASFTPDGESVVFTSNRDGGYDVWELGLAEDAEPVKLTFSRNNYAPAISPDGKWLAFTHNTGPNLTDGDIWLAERDGSNPVQLTDLEGGGWDASWSPDGKFILFATHYQGTIQLFKVEVESGKTTPVTDLVGLRGRNDWSVNDLLSTYIGSPWNREIIVFKPDGSDVRYLTEGGNNLAPSFSPDGWWITFTSYVDRYRDDNGCEIYIMRVDGSDVRRLTDNEYCDWQPRWGP